MTKAGTNPISLSSSRRRVKDDDAPSTHDDEQRTLIQLDGYVSLGFSLYRPAAIITSTSATTTSDHDEEEDDSEAQLDALIQLFLCSRKNVDLVVSLDASTIVSVCPYDDDDETNSRRQRRAQQQQQRHSLLPRQEQHAILQQSLTQQGVVVVGGDDGWRRRRFLNVFEPTDSPGVTVLWNIPKISNEAIPFVDVLGPQGGSTRRRQRRRRRLVDIEHYIRWNFTYPVYQWGDRGDETALQAELDQSIRDGTVDAVLPWPNARASIVGQEGQTFWNQTTTPPGTTTTTPPPSGTVDTTIPTNAADFLQVLGAAIVLATTLAVGLLTFLAKRHRLEKERLMKKYNTDSSDRDSQSQRSFFHVDTEEAVSEMLLESKRYALNKQFDSMATIRVRNGRKMSIEQELKEEQLLLQVKREALSMPMSSSSSSSSSSTDRNKIGISVDFCGKLLTVENDDDDDDDEDAGLESDQDLDFTVPSMHLGSSAGGSAGGSNPRGSLSVRRSFSGSVEGGDDAQAATASTATGEGKSMMGNSSSTSTKHATSDATSEWTTKVIDLDHFTSGNV